MVFNLYRLWPYYQIVIGLVACQGNHSSLVILYVRDEENKDQQQVSHVREPQLWEDQGVAEQDGQQVVTPWPEAEVT